MLKDVFKKINKKICAIDTASLWWLIFPLMALVLTPFIILGEGSVFEIHDQLDEYMMNNVLTARHLGEGLKVLPEMMGGINASGLQPAAVLFVPLYCIFPAFWAFLTQYAAVFVVGFLGMYFCVKELTGSSILATFAAGCFCMLPLYPVYGLSQFGIPLVLYAFLRLRKNKNPWPSLAMVVLFGLTSHLVYTGYAVLGLWAAATSVLLIKQRKSSISHKRKWLVIAFFLLLGMYVIENFNLFAELLLGQGSYVSHREEMVNYAQPFWDTVKSVFTTGAQHIPSLHKNLIFPILIMLIAGGLCYKKMVEQTRRRYFLALAILVFLAAVAFFYAFCKWQPIVGFKNSLSGFPHFFQVERIYWLYPAVWYLEFVLCFSLWWGPPDAKRRGVLQAPLLKLLVLVLFLLPTLQEIKINSYFYMNVNQINNGSHITGYISWESFYAEELMQELEQAVGRNMTTYRVAHLGINPAPALMHGFYTVDGYSNNYPLEYKHRFRQVISKELENNEQTRLYYDEWGNRCYLFNGESGNAWMLGKNRHIVYESLEFDMEALRGLGCEYLFSCGEIKNSEELGLSLLGYYETESSYWGIWLYEL